jgi:hypothetical protein
MNILPLLNRPADVVGAQREEIVEPRHRREKMLRQEVNTLVGKVSYRLGADKKEINADLLKAGHPPRAKASVEQLERIIAQLGQWLEKARP